MSVLMPGPAITERELRARVRQRIDAGALPVLRVAHVDGGYGRDHACAVCEERIAPEQIEYEVHAYRHPRLRFHIKCFSVWQLECAQRIEDEGGSPVGPKPQRGKPDAPEGDGGGRQQSRPWLPIGPPSFGWPAAL